MTRIFQVDSFAEGPFSGNPAAVCLLDGPSGADWMQHVAEEMNLSETAFVHPAGSVFGLRWFTPKAEVEMCGHGTLATAHVLWEEGILQKNDEAAFDTLSGVLRAARRGEEIELDFPATPTTECEPAPGLLEALGVVPEYVGRNEYDYLVRLSSEAAVREAAPDFERLRVVETRGTVLTSTGGSGEFDFVSRFFAPAIGINEDPVTGSAHCSLAPYWSGELGKERMLGYQASTRGGVVRVAARGERVGLGGRAVTVMRGPLTGLASP